MTKRRTKPEDVRLAERIYKSGALFDLHDYCYMRAVGIRHDIVENGGTWEKLAELRELEERAADLSKVTQLIVNVLEL